MAAAAITPSVVQKKTDLVVDSVTGTAVRETNWLLKATKVTQADWIVLQTATGITDITGKIIHFGAVINDSSNNMVIDTVTYTDTGDKLTLTGATVGTAWISLRTIE